ncbi:MAG: hypothetical protein MR345_02125 [Bacilli bacterium]|nr:hypothetical protein [Bacilli bacterium]
MIRVMTKSIKNKEVIVLLPLGSEFLSFERVFMQACENIFLLSTAIKKREVKVYGS